MRRRWPRFGLEPGQLDNGSSPRVPPSFVCGNGRLAGVPPGPSTSPVERACVLLGAAVVDPCLRAPLSWLGNSCTRR